MPNRILRDWTDSAAVDKLSWQEEVLFTRLIMKADDFGNFYRNSSLVKSLLFPRKDGLRPSDIDRWLHNVEVAGLIRCYNVKGESYLHIRNFKQRLDRTSRKFPSEPANIDDDNQPPRNAAEGYEAPPETKRNEVETETETREQSSTRDDFTQQNFSFKNPNPEKEKSSAKKESQPDTEQKISVTLPFDTHFSDLWQKWKDYKSKEFKFKYKSKMSEQAALNELVTLAGGIEATAIAIIHQSMAKGWKGFFELKNKNYGTGNSESKTGSGSNLREQVNAAFAKRYPSG